MLVNDLDANVHQADNDGAIPLYIACYILLVTTVMSQWCVCYVLAIYRSYYLRQVYFDALYE